MTTREGGTGLGLAIVGKILEDHGGRIELRDRADGARGATVRFWLPLKPPPVPEEPPANLSQTSTANQTAAAK
jgi:two-component system nitrogen regulation sensor histidine kinase NtrY